MIRGSGWWIWAGLFVIFIVASLPGLFGPLFFDDYSSIVTNSWVTEQDGSFENLRAATLSGVAGPLKRPISMLSFALHSFFPGADSIWIMKFVGVVLHACIGGLIFELLRIFFTFQSYTVVARVSSPSRNNKHIGLVPIVCTAIWVLHPLHVSTVFYVVQRMAQLSMLFSLIALLCYVRARFRWKDTKPQCDDIVGTGVWIAFGVTLAVLSKENGLMILPIIAACEYFFFRGVVNGVERRWLQLSSLLSVLAIPVFLISAVLIQPDWLVQGYVGRDFTLVERMLTQVGVVASYLGWFFVPRLGVFSLYQDDWPVVSTIWAIEFWFPAIFLAGLVVLIVFLRRRIPLVSLGLTIFLVGHAMESSILALELVFEHRNYLPTFGLAIALVPLCQAIFSRLTKREFAAIVGGVLLTLTLQLHLRALTWSNSFSLYHHMVLEHPDSYRSQVDYAAFVLEGLSQSPELDTSSEEFFASLSSVQEHLERADRLDSMRIRHLALQLLVEVRYGGDQIVLDSLLEEVGQALANGLLNATDIDALAGLVHLTAESGCTAQCRVSLISALKNFMRLYPQFLGLASEAYELGVSGGYADLTRGAKDVLRESMPGSIPGTPLIDDALRENETALALQRLRADLMSDRWMLGSRLYRLYAQTIAIQSTQRKPALD